MKKSTDNQFKILVVDDEAIVMMAQSMMFEHLGHKVDKAENGQKALQMASNGYDLILVDIGLPDTNGMDVAAKIRSKETSLRKAYIVAVTGYVANEVREQCAHAGINAVFNKPLNSEAIQKILASV